MEEGRDRDGNGTRRKRREKRCTMVYEGENAEPNNYGKGLDDETPMKQFN